MSPLWRRWGTLFACPRFGDSQIGCPPPPPLDALIAERHARAAAFGRDLVSPGWTLLLTLYRAHLAGPTHPVPVEGAHLQRQPLRFGRLIAAARVPMTTASRWLDRLEAAGLVERRPDPTHATALLVSLTPAGAEAIHRHFAAQAEG